MASPSPILQALRRHPKLDPQAVLKVAGVEGLSGGIGDGGHAFGPFQLNDAGGVLTGKLPGLNAQQKNAWAWSPQGLEYALQGIDRVAAGQHGSRAVNSIVRDFERPADPNGEVARALGSSSTFGGGDAPSAPSPPGAPAADSRRQFALSLLGAISPTGQLDNPSSLVAALQQRNAGWSPHQGSGAKVGGKAGQGQSGLPPVKKSGLLELLQEGTGGPTHSTGPHIHAAFGNPQLELQAIQWAQGHGLHVGENPYVGDTVDPVHAKNSYHYRTFPGLFNGRKLGQAVDVSGPNARSFYDFLAGRRG